ncbi:MAG: erg26, C-3 sterol dehydrogenase [Thelocarpon impressellum]|nr:MAG: erg26, C-3 sterol dehydrogenase [Thelocarpon impressellum]
MAPSTAPASLGCVLVVGGCGFLGHHIVRQLAEAAEARSVAVLDVRTARNRVDSAKVAYHEGDITSAASLLPIFQQVRPDVVIHTASPVASAGVDRELFQRVNVDGTRALIEVAGRTGVRAFVYTSSASVVSDGVTDLVNADERWPYVPRERQTEFYTQTKADAEDFVLKATRSPAHNGMQTLALRPAGIFGEGDAQAIPGFMLAYRNGRTGFQLGRNDNLFDWTYVGNAAAAHVLAAAALLASHAADTLPPPEARVDGEAFFVTNDAPVYFWDLPRAVWRLAGDSTGTDVWVLSEGVGLFLSSVVEAVGGLLGKKMAPTRQQVGFSCRTRYYSCDKAKARLGYAPRVGLQEGVRRSVAWFLEKEAAEAAKKAQ